jgi:hypothetical protein
LEKIKKSVVAGSGAKGHGSSNYSQRHSLDIILNKLKDLHEKRKMKACKPCILPEEYVTKGWTGEKPEEGSRNEI